MNASKQQFNNIKKMIIVKKFSNIIVLNDILIEIQLNLTKWNVIEFKWTNIL